MNYDDIKASAEDCAWENNDAYTAYVDRFDDLLSCMMDENIKLGPEVKFAVLDWLENAIKRRKQGIMDDCDQAVRESMEMDIGDICDMGDM